jgi:hypothetical protein
MTALASRRRRNTVLALAAGVVVAVVAPTLVYVGANAISNSTAGRNALGNALPEQTFPQTPTAMLATVNDTNELTSVTVFVLAPDSDVTPGGYDQRGGSVVSIPINADPGSGDQLLSLHDAYALGGEAELRAELESAINLTIDSSKVMTADEFAGFLEGLPAIQADLPRDVLGTDDAVLFPKGPTTLTAEQAAQIITTRSPTERERLRQPNIEALWQGIADAVGQGRQGQTLSAAVPTTFAETATRLTAGPIASRGLLTRPLESDRNPEGLDVDALDRPDTVLVFSSIAPASVTRPASGLSFRIEAPPGYDQQVRKTIAILMAFGGNVVSVDLNAPPQPNTVFYIYDPALAAAEPTDHAVFGPITVETPDVRLGGVDQTILLGTDYLDQVDLTAADATSTSIDPTQATV